MPEDITKKAREALRKAVNGLGAYHMDACVKCGLCGESCHIYLTDRVPEKSSRI